MIETVRIQGFMSHFDTEFNFTEGLNCITGLNDSGKSSILHALRWFIMGEPKGDKFRTRIEAKGRVLEAKETKVEIVKDGLTMAKVRPAVGPAYYVLEDEIYYKNDMPEEIQMCLDIKNLYTFGLTELELNFVFQLDMPFLLSEAPSVGAMILGTLANTAVVDDAAKDFATEAFNTKRERTANEGKELSLLNALKEYDGLDDIIQDLEQCQTTLSVVDALEQKKQLLSNLHKEYIKSIQTIDSLQTVLYRLPDIEKMHGLASLCETSFDRITKLVGVKDKYRELWNILHESKRTVAIVNNILQADSLVTSVSDTYTLSSSLKQLDDSFNYVHGDLQEYEANYIKCVNISSTSDTVDHVINCEVKRTKYYNLYNAYGALVLTRNAINNKFKAVNTILSLDVQSICMDFDKRTKLNKVYIEYGIKQQYLNTVSTQLSNTDVDDVEREYNAMLKEIGVCPLCNSVL